MGDHPVRILFECHESIARIADVGFWAVTLLSGSLIIVALLRFLGTLVSRERDS